MADKSPLGCLDPRGAYQNQGQANEGPEGAGPDLEAAFPSLEELTTTAVRLTCPITTPTNYWNSGIVFWEACGSLGALPMYRLWRVASGRTVWLTRAGEETGSRGSPCQGKATGK